MMQAQAVVGGNAPNAYAAFGSQVNAGAPRALSAFEEISGAVAGLAAAADRAVVLANRLVGSEPTMSPKIESPVAGYDGAIPQLQADAESIRRLTIRINDDLSRIERALP